jgi:hypothetical protein
MSQQIIDISKRYAELDWTVVRGDTFLEEFAIKENGVLVDLTGSTFEMKVTDTRGVLLDTLTLGNGITVISLGTVRCHREDVETATWTDCGAMFVFKWTRPTVPQTIRTIIKGII